MGLTKIGQFLMLLLLFEQRFVQVLYLFLLLAHGPGDDTGTSADDGQVMMTPDAGVVMD